MFTSGIIPMASQVELPQASSAVYDPDEWTELDVESRFFAPAEPCAELTNLIPAPQTSGAGSTADRLQTAECAETDSELDVELSFLA